MSSRYATLVGLDGDAPATNGDVPPSHADYLRSRLLTTEQIRKLPPPAPLIDGYLYLNSLAAIYGGSGIGKTHIGIDMASSVTSRDWWFAVASHAVTCSTSSLRALPASGSAPKRGRNGTKRPAS